MANASQHHRYSSRKHIVHGLCLFTSRPSGALVEVDGNVAFPEGEAAVEGAGAPKDRIE